MEEALFHRVAKALSDPRRLQILEKLNVDDELSCGALVCSIGGAQPTVSHHLKELVNADLVEIRSEGTFNYYRLRRDVLQAYNREIQRRFRLPETP